MTQFLYCSGCQKAIEKEFAELLSPKDFTLTKVHGIIGNVIVMAGYIRGMGIGEEAQIMENDILPRLIDKVCCPVRFAVVTDSSGTYEFTVDPRTKKIIGGYFEGGEVT